ncbi:MAG: filamentous hemagglutinin N-terminal domain-containing protein [Alphaproteobacteria bacterium]
MILGSLSGAGSITLVNPAGISFGASATVDVGAITATTLDILNSRFMADELVFDGYNDRFATASVINDGTITWRTRAWRRWLCLAWQTTA